MAQLSTKIKEYCKANGVSEVDFEDVKLQDDSNGQGPTLKSGISLVWLNQLTHN